jgi:hypothetical protein
MRDQKNSLAFRPVIAPVVVGDNTAQIGTIIDRLGFDALTFVVCAGILADTDATFDTLLEESDASDMSGANAVAAGNLLGSQSSGDFIFSDDGAVKSVGYVGNKRYVRLTITPAGNTASAPITALAVLGRPRTAPTA